MFRLLKKRLIFRVLIRGDNVLLRDMDSGIVERLGFYMTIFVKAADESAAVVAAKTQVSNALAELEPLNDPLDQINVEMAEVGIVDKFQDASGFAFFPKVEN